MQSFRPRTPRKNQAIARCYTETATVRIRIAGRSTIDAILALRLLAEIHHEFDRPLHVAFLDIKAAFDSVDRQALWKALRSRGISRTFSWI